MTSAAAHICDAHKDESDDPMMWSRAKMRISTLPDGINDRRARDSCGLHMRRVIAEVSGPEQDPVYITWFK